MLGFKQPSRRGFTLVELAIVLAIAGLLFVGLWRLLAGANQQSRDAAAANMQSQLITAVKGFLASTQGQGWLGAIDPTVNRNKNLVLPTVAAGSAGCPASLPATQNTLCTYLPAGFISGGASPTVNSYSQTFVVQVQKDTTAAPNPPTTYSFMIYTTAGDIIPDSSGGRVSSLIGGDGGFRYSAAAGVCGAATLACGAYGSWTANIAGAATLTPPGFSGADPGGGHVASRTYVSIDQNSTLPWLERNTTIQPDPTFSWNTMTTDLYMGSTPAIPGPPAPTNINMAPFGVTVGGGNINLQGGMVTGSGTSRISIINPAGSPSINPQVNIASGCIQTAPGAPAACPYTLQVTGDVNVSNLLNANALYANTFIYQSSDIRLKTNIQPIVSGLAQIMQLKPVSFAFKANGKESLGVIAQDIEKVYPQLVSQGNQGMKSVNYEGLIAPLISAVQELKHENDALREELRKQEIRQKNVERKIGQGAD